MKLGSQEELIDTFKNLQKALMATLRTVVTMKILKTSLIMQPNFAIKRWFFKFLISNSMI